MNMDQGVSKPDGAPGTPVPKKALIKLSDMKPGALAHIFGDGQLGPGPDEEYVPDDDFEPTLSMDEAMEAYRRGADFFSVPPRAAGVEAFNALENPENLAERIKAIREMIRAEFVPLPPQVGEDLTPRQAAIRYVDMWMEWLVLDLENKDHRESTVAQALGLGAALMYLAVSKSTTGTQNTGTRALATGDVLAAAVAPDKEMILAQIEAAAARGGEQGGRRGGKEGVRREFRERDKKTRKNQKRLKDGQYDGEDWAKYWEKVQKEIDRRKGAEGKLKWGELTAILKKVYGSEMPTKITYARFKRQWHADHPGSAFTKRRPAHP